MAEPRAETLNSPERRLAALVPVRQTLHLGKLVATEVSRLLVAGQSECSALRMTEPSLREAAVARVKRTPGPSHVPLLVSLPGPEPITFVIQVGRTVDVRFPN